MIDNWILPSTAAAAYAAVPPADWPHWVRYDNDLERRKRTCDRASFLPGILPAALWSLGRPNLKVLVEGLYGPGEILPDVEFRGGGVHVMEPGGWLQPHLDARLNREGLERRANAVLFLNPQWKEEWGGAFELYGSDGETVISRVYPAPGRLVLFDPTGDDAFHGTQEVQCPPDVVRATLAAFYLSQPRPGATQRRRALFVPRRCRAS